MEESKRYQLNIVVFGANSEIVKEILRLYAEKNYFYLISRDEEKLGHLKGDLVSRGAEDVSISSIDFTNEKLVNVYGNIINHFSKIDLLIVAHGSLPIQAEVEDDIFSIDELASINFSSYIKILNIFGKYFEQQQTGAIAVFTSVAGDRGRRSNYIYGSFKAGKQAFLQGFSARMSRSNVHVLDIRPGMVRTPMTAHLPQGPLFATPSSVAKSIFNAIEKKQYVLYTPFFWRYIMLVIKLIPRKIFNRLSF